MSPCLCTFSVVLETSQCAKKGLKQNSHKCYQIVSSCWPHCWRVNCVLARRFETMPMKANDAVVPTMQLWQGGFFERCNSPPENLFCCEWSFARLHIWSSSLWHQRVYILFHISSLQKTTKWCRCYDAAGFEEQLAAIEVLGKHLLRTVTIRLTRLSSGAGYWDDEHEKRAAYWLKKLGPAHMVMYYKEIWWVMDKYGQELYRALRGAIGTCTDWFNQW